MRTNSQGRGLFQSFTFYISLILFECASVITYLALLSTDPKNIWLLGLSKSRWISIVGVAFLGSLFILGLVFLLIKKRKGEIKSLAKQLVNFHNKVHFVRVVGFSLLFVLTGVLTFHYFLNLQVNTVVMRLAPMLILGELIIFQSGILLTFLHSIFTDQSLSQSFIDIYFFPYLQRNVFIKPGRVIHRIFNFVESQIEKLANKLNRKVLIGIIILTPILITLSLVWLSFGTSLSSYIPTGSDEMVYWREILTYSAVGFEGGQYSTDELTAQVDLSHFDAHGPAFPVFYGIFGRTFGWQLISGVILNHIFLLLALVTFIYLSQPDNKQLLLLWLLLVTFWPIWLYMPTTRVEGLFFSFAIILAGLFSRRFAQNKNIVWVSILLCIVILFAGTFRLSWSLLFFSLLGVLIGKYSLKNLFKVILLSIFPITLLILYFKFLVSPYPLFSYNTIHSLGEGELDQLVPIFSNFFKNIVYFFSTKDTSIYILLRYQMLWVLIVSIVDFYNTLKYSQGTKPTQSDHISYLNSSNLGLVVLFNLAVHTVHAGREYRLWAPHLLLTLLVLLFSSRKQMVLGVIISNLIFLTAFGNTFYKERYSNFLRDNSDIAEIQTSISEFITYDPVDNHWCNTIDVSRYSRAVTWGPWMLALPEEFGVTSIINWEVFYKKRIMAKYVLLDPEYIHENTPYLFGNTNLEPLAETPIGTLYYNRDSNCSSIK